MSDIYESKLVKIKARRSFRSDIIWKFGPSSSYLLVLIATYGLSTSLHLSIYQSVHAPVAVFAATGKPLEIKQQPSLTQTIHIYYLSCLHVKPTYLKFREKKCVYFVWRKGKDFDKKLIELYACWVATSFIDRVILKLLVKQQRFICTW